MTSPANAFSIGMEAPYGLPSLPSSYPLNRDRYFSKSQNMHSRIVSKKLEIFQKSFEKSCTKKIDIFEEKNDKNCIFWAKH